MTDFFDKVKRYRDPERMAADYLKAYYSNEKIEYPINPFKMLKDSGTIFVLGNYHKLEGLYIPPTSSDDIAFIGINNKRPITRQRFTAAHELCHHLRDSDKEIACPIGNKDETEYFADGFASALLMPIDELIKQVNDHKANKFDRYITFDSVLEIADYFGVSFEACLFRIAYRIHAIEGNTESKALRKRAQKYSPDKKRKEKQMNYLRLYEGLIDSYGDILSFKPNDHARLVFQNDYIYNDSRMEGVGISMEEAAEIVTDIRLNEQDSEYCSEANEAFLSVAGHYAMYQDIFALPVKEKCSVFDAVGLNKKLFSYYPHPESYGGCFRQSNTLVLGAKFETIPYHLIPTEMLKIDDTVKSLINNKDTLSLSEYIKAVIRVHHSLTVIHPFADGNGRTLRAFFNVLLIRGGITPIYIKLEEKDEYLNALSVADTCGSYTELYECIYKVLLRSSVELNKACF